MYQSNFRRLTDEIKKQQAINNQGSKKAMRKSLSKTHKKVPTLKSLCKSAQNLGLNKIKFDPLSKSERRMINRMNMRNFRTSLRESCMNKSLTSIEVCRLETQVNNLSTALASKGLL